MVNAFDVNVDHSPKLLWRHFPKRRIFVDQSSIVHKQIRGAQFFDHALRPFFYSGSIADID